VAAYSLARGAQGERKNLRATLFNPSYAERQVALAARIDELEAKLRAIEEHPGIDHQAVLAATTHTRLLCSPSGYALSDVDGTCSVSVTGGSANGVGTFAGWEPCAASLRRVVWLNQPVRDPRRGL